MRRVSRFHLPESRNFYHADCACMPCCVAPLSPCCHCFLDCSMMCVAIHFITKLCYRTLFHAPCRRIFQGQPRGHQCCRRAHQSSTEGFEGATPHTPPAATMYQCSPHLLTTSLSLFLIHLITPSQNATMGTVAQVKIPMRLVKEAFKVSQEDINAAGEHAKVLVRGVKVFLHADGEMQPGHIMADIRGKNGADAYLTTKDYGECRQFVPGRGGRGGTVVVGLIHHSLVSVCRHRECIQPIHV